MENKSELILNILAVSVSVSVKERISSFKGECSMGEITIKQMRLHHTAEYPDINPAAGSWFYLYFLVLVVKNVA
ncbi:hypothetical protein R5R35_007200 [Gryllus longicercus]|uniref:Uncharacterized protein n=1 Tax=Gryllus longicercus TaxID=2509291 RepID=A0AAN9VVR9_9ORTH